MGGLTNMPGMPSSKGLDSRGNRGSQGGNKPPRLGNNFKSNLGAGYNKPGAPNSLQSGGLNAFNVPKYG